MKNIQLLSFTMIMLFLLTACNLQTQATPTPSGDISTPTPEVFNPLAPSPTLSSSDLPLTCQVTDLNVQVDLEAGYCYAYPLRFTLADFPLLGTSAVQGQPVDSSPDRVAASFAVGVEPLDPNLSLDQQVDSFLKTFTTVDSQSFTRARLNVAGETAIQVDIVPVQLSWRLVFVPYDGRLYRLMYWPVDLPEAQADLDELYQTTINTFAFLQPDVTIELDATPTVEPASFDGLEVSYGPLNLVIPQGVANAGTGSQVPRLDGQDPAWWQLTPCHTQLMLDGYSLAAKSRQPLIAVYPAQEFADLQTLAGENISQLRSILENPATPINVEQVPAVPFFNEIPVYTSSIRMLPFQNGQGVRSLTQYGQYAAPANNQELFYHFQGLTNDGAHYIVAILPITAPGLGESSDPASAKPVGGVDYPTPGDPNANWRAYYTAVTDLLNATPPGAFSPSLDQLDALIQSIQITP